ncbi:putative exported protein [Halobacteriovorax marinus SJ]|uniref:Exported protein n=1 Tax=Halobacteriovorax marinus (strain ATCC BAA-682 / DSM 15412 / SJ) TaxID=862908 RepID=E1X3D3_HALMS|nr:hypothetical protein [Halobacteriovorax marinus]CBW25228.1 putative exported protein [Halobacteriovorax marinus SJ]
MRVYLLSILLFIFTLQAGAITCEERILNQYNDDFHRFLEEKFSENSNLELFKTFGFLGKPTEHGFKMVLNTSIDAMAGSESMKLFEQAASEFVKSKARGGTDYEVLRGHLFFFPEDSNLVCQSASVYLDEAAPICSINEIKFNSGRIGELKSFLDNIFENIPQMELEEVDPNPYKVEKRVRINMKDELFSSTNFELKVVGGNCDLEGGLKREFNCTAVLGESIELNLRVENLNDDIVLEVSSKDGYSLNPVEGKTYEYEIEKKSLSKEDEILSSENFEIVSGECKGEGTRIICEAPSETYTLKVIPEGKTSEEMSLDLSPSHGFELKLRPDESAQFKIVQAFFYDSSENSLEELAKVEFATNDNCTVISSKIKILKCKKLLEPYSVEATYSGSVVEVKRVEIGSFEEFSLKLTRSNADSLSQDDQVVVLGDGEEISPSSFDEYGIKLNITTDPSHEFTYSKSQSLISSKKEDESYSLKIDLLHNSKVVDSKNISIDKYIAGDNYFFDIIKGNRRCQYRLMKFAGNDNFLGIGQEEYISKLMKVEVEASRASCSDVQQGKDSIQGFCTLRRDKLQDRVTIKLISNGAVVRSTSCLIVNEDYNDDDEDEDDDRVFRSSSSSSAYADQLTDSISKAIPNYFSSKYQTQQPSYYNPLMYNYGYYPYSNYSPGYYQSPGLWNTMYMFNPATY